MTDIPRPSEAHELDALFPDPARVRPRVPPPAVPPVSLDLDEEFGPNGTESELIAELEAGLGAATAPMEAMWRVYWAVPRRTLWTPCIAGAIVHLHEAEPRLLTRPSLKKAAGLIGEGGAPGLLAAHDVAERVASCQLVLAGIPALRVLLPEELVLAELGFERDDPLAERVKRAEEWLTTTELPLPWVALMLATQLALGRNRLEGFLLGVRPFTALADRFGAMAERQSLRTWEDAVRASLAFWREARGDLVLRLVLTADTERYLRRMRHRDDRLEARKAAAAPRRRVLNKLESQLAEAKREAALARDQAVLWQRELGEARREAGEARQARDRAVVRLRALEREHAELLSRLPEPVAEPMPVAAAEVPVPAPVPAPSPTLESVFDGRLVYLYTGQERAAARRDMAKALERYGAICEVMDGNRLGELGPERFDPDALIIIDTRFLGHAASELIEERARASGAWFYVGPTGQGALARKVAERWWKTHGG